MPKALPDGVMLTTGATAISTAQAIDMASQATATGRVRLVGSEPLGNTNARATRQANAITQPDPFAQTVNDSNDVVVPALIAAMEPLTITLPSASPTPISTSSQAMGWRGRRAARTRPVPAYATSRMMPAGATMNRLAANRMTARRPTEDGAEPPRRPGSPSRYRRASHRSASRAAWTPHMPWTPPPGGVDDEHRNSARVRRRVRVPADDRAEQELADVLDAAVDVAADVVRVVRLHRGRVPDGPSEDEVAEARARTARPAPRSPRSRRRSSRSARGSTPRRRACPRARATGRRSSAGRAGRTGDPRTAPAMDRVLRRRDLAHRPAEVHRAGPQRCARRATGSGRRAPSRPCARPGRSGSPRAGAGSRVAAGRRRPRATWRGVRSSSDGARRRQLVERRHPPVRLDLDAERPRLRLERRGDLPAPAPRHRPADGVREQPEHEPERRRQRLPEPEHRVRRHAGEQRPRRRLAEAQPARASSPGAAPAGRSAP